MADGEDEDESQDQGRTPFVPIWRLDRYLDHPLKLTGEAGMHRAVAVVGGLGNDLVGVPVGEVGHGEGVMSRSACRRQ